MFDVFFKILSPKKILKFFGLDSLCPTHAARMLRMKSPIMTMNNATNEQLELGFNGHPPPVFNPA